jgi:hypothetical protein
MGTHDVVYDPRRTIYYYIYRRISDITHNTIISHRYTTRIVSVSSEICCARIHVVVKSINPAVCRGDCVTAAAVTGLRPGKNDSTIGTCI